MNQSHVAERTTLRPTSAAALKEIVMQAQTVLPHGTRTKPALLNVPKDVNVTHIDMTGIAGMVEYDPGEYTFTALAGTKLADIASTLAEHGQSMPFDPPLVDAGATLGGAIAAGLSASGRYRFGGVRDFILGVEFVDGQARLIRGGGKVVKNAAGFDLPKLLVGSMGRLGIIVQATFKVFPAPPATATLVATLPTLTDALAASARLTGGPYDIESLDLAPMPDGRVTLLARIGGPSEVLPTRLDRLRSLVGSGDALLDDKALWLELREFAWADASHNLVKVATTPRALPALDRALSAAERRYSVGGNLAWFTWPGSIDPCHQMLLEQKHSGLVARGPSPRALIGVPVAFNFLKRIQSALDPNHRFVDFEYENHATRD